MKLDGSDLAFFGCAVVIIASGVGLIGAIIYFIVHLANALS